MNEKKRRTDKSLPYEVCEYGRQIIFIDSYLHLNCSLAAAVQDVRNVAAKTDIPLQKMFKVSHFFGKVDCRYTNDQMEALISGKLTFPFNLCVNIDELANVTEIPEREAFTDLLSGGKTVSEADHEHFSYLWTILGFDNLLTCLFVYR